MTLKIGVYLTDEVAKAFRGELRRSGMTKSFIVNNALILYLNPPRMSEPAVRLLDKVNALCKHVRLLQREVEVMSETFAVFARYFLMVTPPVPESELVAAKALGRERYKVFIGQIAKRLSSDKGLITDVVRMIVVTHPRLVVEAVAEARKQNAIADLFSANGHVVRPVEPAESLSHG